MNVNALDVDGAFEFKLAAEQIQETRQVEFSLIDVLNEALKAHRFGVTSWRSVDDRGHDAVLGGAQFGRDLLLVALLQVVTENKANPERRMVNRIGDAVSMIKLGDTKTDVGINRENHSVLLCLLRPLFQLLDDPLVGYRHAFLDPDAEHEDRPCPANLSENQFHGDVETVGLAIGRPGKGDTTHTDASVAKRFHPFIKLWLLRAHRDTLVADLLHDGRDLFHGNHAHVVAVVDNSELAILSSVLCLGVWADMGKH